jgi:hypothetical protein
MLTKRTRPPWRRVISRLLPGRDPGASVAASERAATKCFGPLEEREQLALEALTGGHRRPARSALYEPPGRDPRSLAASAMGTKASHLPVLYDSQ